jgi:hypothetical protein
MVMNHYFLLLVDQELVQQFFQNMRDRKARDRSCKTRGASKATKN